LTLKLYQLHGIGEILITLTGFHGQEINIFQLIAEVVGLMEQPAQLLTESILSEIEHGQI